LYINSEQKKTEKRKNKIIFIYEVKDFEAGKVRNLLREVDIKKIASAFTQYEDIDRYCHIANFEEVKENEFNLNVPRYVDTSELEEKINVQETIDELIKLEKEKQELEVQVAKNLKELGFKV